jgi:hypothetical protein
LYKTVSGTTPSLNSGLADAQLKTPKKAEQSEISLIGKHNAHLASEAKVVIDIDLTAAAELRTVI